VVFVEHVRYSLLDVEVREGEELNVYASCSLNASVTPLLGVEEG
jgi:hypothetical protein